jgi:hypothetical protein
LNTGYICEELYKKSIIYNRLFPLEKRKEKETILFNYICIGETLSKWTIFPQSFSDILSGYTCPVMQWGLNQLDRASIDSIGPASTRGRPALARGG